MRTRITLLLLTCLSLGAAQAQLEKTGVAALPTPDGALLRWFLPGDVVPTQGFELRVTDPAGDRSVKVASLPPYSAALGLSQGEYDGLSAIYGRPPTSEGEQVQRALFNLNVLAHPAYARALGISTTLKGLSPGQHTVTVYALGTSSSAQVGKATFRTGPTPKVPPPTGLKASGGLPKVNLNWTPVPENDSNLVVAYTISRAVSGGSFNVVKPSPYFLGTDQGFQDTTVQAGQRYVYRITSLDLFGRESVPSTPVTLAVAATTILESPEIASATAGDMAITLTWAASGDPRVRSLLLLRGTDQDNLSTLARLPADANQYVDRSIKGGVNYFYALAAADASGQASGRSTLTTAPGLNLTPPTAPSGVKLISGENDLTLNWNSSSETDLRGYLIYRFEGKQTIADEVLLTGTPIQANSYTDAIPQGVQTNYHYRVVAVNTSQTQSPPSLPVTAALLDKTPPPTPVLNPVSIEGAAVRLNWAQAEVPDLSRFEVLRTGGASPVVVGNVGQDVRSYLDSTAKPGIPYTYSVISLDQAGNRSAPAEPVAAILPDQSRPLLAAPQALLLPAGGVQVSWKAANGPALYVVYRLSGERATDISGLLTASSFTDMDGSAGVRYQVRMVGADGDLGQPSSSSEPAH